MSVCGTLVLQYGDDYQIKQIRSEDVLSEEVCAKHQRRTLKEQKKEQIN